MNIDNFVVGLFAVLIVPGIKSVSSYCYLRFVMSIFLLHMT